jgi:hypothetical protein
MAAVAYSHAGYGRAVGSHCHIRQHDEQYAKELPFF